MLMSGNSYSSSDDASSDGAISSWSDEAEEDQHLLEQEEKQVEENQTAVEVGRPKKRKSAAYPPMLIELLSSQKKMKDGSISYLAIFEGEVFKCSGQVDLARIQQWVCVKHVEGCKEVIVANQSFCMAY